MKQVTSLKSLKKEAKQVYEQHEEIVDIIIFGSLQRGKERPRDIDIIILFNRKIDRAILKQHNALHKTYVDFFLNFPTESILSEGYSLIFEKKLDELYNMASYYFFRYSLKNKGKSDRMRFYYALYGRNTQGVMEKTESVKFSDMVILTPIHQVEQMKLFFQDSETEYFSLPVLFPATYSKAEKLSIHK